MKFTFRRVLLALMATTLLLVGFAVYFFNQRIRNSYTVWWAADMVIEHLKTHDNQWPGSWEDLHDDYQTLTQRSGQPWTFAEIRERVSIDFTVNGRELCESAGSLSYPTFRAIRTADGTEAFWQSHEPNTMILNHLRGIIAPRPVITGHGGSSPE